MLVGLDFETYYDKTYTLRKLSTSEYVRDPRFEAMCLGVKFEGEPRRVIAPAEIAVELHKMELWKHTVLCHHAHFDGLILSHHYGVYPRRFACTLSMARAVRPKTVRNDLNTVAEFYGKGNKLPDILASVKGKHYADLTNEERIQLFLYCGTDVDLMMDIYPELLKALPEAELDLIDLTVRMFTTPVLKLNQARAKRELTRERTDRCALITASGVDEPTLMSNPKFAKALVALGVTPPMKVSKTTGKDTLAFAQTDLEFTALEQHPNPRVVALIKGRLAAKSTQTVTRVARLLKLGAKGQEMPVYLNYCGAHTTRWSGGDKMNFQNFRRAEFSATGEYIAPSAELRRSIKAPTGYVIVVVDSGQIECRSTGWLAGQDDLLETFRKKEDPYCALASFVYGRPITKADKLERYIGKVGVLGLGYSMGADKFQLTLAQGIMGPAVFLDASVCQAVVRTYRAKNSKIVDFWDFANNQIIGDMLTKRAGEYKCLRWDEHGVLLPNGLTLHYPGLTGFVRKAWGTNKEVVDNAKYMTIKGMAHIYGGLFLQNLIEGLARDIVATQMLEIAKRYRVVMMSHDEVVYLAPRKEAKEALDFGLKIMQTPPWWGPDLPLSAEGGYDTCYSK